MDIGEKPASVFQIPFSREPASSANLTSINFSQSRFHGDIYVYRACRRHLSEFSATPFCSRCSIKPFPKRTTRYRSHATPFSSRSRTVAKIIGSPRIFFSFSLSFPFPSPSLFSFLFSFSFFLHFISKLRLER